MSSKKRKKGIIVLHQTKKGGALGGRAGMFLFSSPMQKKKKEKENLPTVEMEEEKVKGITRCPSQYLLKRKKGGRGVSSFFVRRKGKNLQRGDCRKKRKVEASPITCFFRGRKRKEGGGINHFPPCLSS